METDGTLRITFRAPRALVEKLQEHCRESETELKPSQVMRSLLKRYLEQINPGKAKTKPTKATR